MVTRHDLSEGRYPYSGQPRSERPLNLLLGATEGTSYPVLILNLPIGKAHFPTKLSTLKLRRLDGVRCQVAEVLGDAH